MPKERFHLYLADELLKRCKNGFSVKPFCGENLFLPADSSASFFTGALSPDIFYYDLPSFNLSPLGDALHTLLDRKGIAVIYDWITQADACRKVDSAAGRNNKTKMPWALGFACHFAADAAWHPLINDLSRSHLYPPYGAGKKMSEIECHRLIESELESLRITNSAEKYDDFLRDFRQNRHSLAEVAYNYGEFLDFCGLHTPRKGSGSRQIKRVPPGRIVRCFLWQNFFLRMFSNRTLGRYRDLLLSFAPTRSLGVLTTPAKAFLPELFFRTFPEERNPFSDFFLGKAIDFMEESLCRSEARGLSSED